jgi:hypothetical protein
MGPKGVPNTKIVGRKINFNYNFSLSLQRFQPTISVFKDVTICSLLKVNLRFGRTCHFHLQGRRINQERNQRETGNSREIRFCETSVDFQRTTRLYIPEDRSLHPSVCLGHGDIRRRLKHI